MKQKSKHSTGHGCGVRKKKTPIVPLRTRLESRNCPTAQMRLYGPGNDHVIRDYRSIRIENKKRRDRAAGRSIFFQLTKLAYGEARETMKKARAARRGENYERPAYLDNLKAAIKNAGRMILGKR